MTARKGTPALPMLLGLLALAAPSAAQVYKWVDQSGTIHFSDSPPPRAAGAPAVEVLPEGAPRPRPTSAPALPEAAPARGGVAAPPVEERAYEPEVEEEAATEAIIIDNGPDPAVRWRANSPRNQPGQPIRQPGGRQPRRAR